MLRIDLSDNRFMSLDEPSVDLLFATDSQYFYLLFTSLVARQMKQLADEINEMPFVSFMRISEDVTSLAVAHYNGDRSLDKLAMQLYRTWNRRMRPDYPECLYEPSRVLDRQEAEAVANLFELRSGRAGVNAEYRLHVPAEQITFLHPQILDRLLEKTAVSTISRPDPLRHIPEKPFYEGINLHDTYIKNLRLLMLSPDAPRATLLWGMGGLGKSTLAAQLARSLAGEGSYASAFWVQADIPEQEAGESRKWLLEHTVDSLIIQMGLLDYVHEEAIGKLAHLRRCEQLREALLVMDNVEPGKHSPQSILHLIEELRPAHVIITSRADCDLVTCTHQQITPLDSEEGEVFLRRDARTRRLESFLPRDRHSIQAMAEATGGSPFAMQLALGQATRIPWNSVIHGIAGSRSHLYRYLFYDLWQLLSSLEQKLLIYMRTSPAGIDIDELTDTDIASHNDVLAGMDTLVKLALVNVSHLDQQSARYSLHPLTVNFLESDLPKLWAKGDEARE